MRLLITLLLLALLASDATAGPLSRFRARRAGGCTPAAPTFAAPAQAAPTRHATAYPAPAAGGCANGKCPLK